MVTPAKFIVFQDNLTGMTHVPKLDGNTFADVSNNITEGVGAYVPSQHWMYFIYMLHEDNVPVYGNRWQVYRYVKAIAGSKVEPIFQNHRSGLLYALTKEGMSYNNGDPAWFFSDKLFA
jgi:hypothetical protein